MAVSTRRGKRSSNKVATKPEATASSSSSSNNDETTEAQPAALSALSPPQFSILVCISLAFTHFMDLFKTISSTDGIIHYGKGIIASENITSIPINATAYCARHFQSNATVDAVANAASSSSSSKEEIIAKLGTGCTPSDLSIVNIKMETTVLRLALCAITTMLCWGNQPLLKSWAYAYSVFIMITLAGYMSQTEYLRGSEKYSLLAMLVLLLTSNRRGRQGRVRVDIDEGLFNLVLFLLVVLMSMLIGIHATMGIEDFTTLSVEDVTDGGKALWYMTMVVEYSIIMVIGSFALFFFDEWRKRALLICMSFVTVHHAFIQLPNQKEFWVDAKTRQTLVMVLFACMLAGGLLPSFNKFVIKK